ncbi:hypothetical protein ES705_33574 [subsurface metagenome]
MAYQSKFFTTEQMSGSGQLNLIDLIERTQEKLKKPKRNEKNNRRRSAKNINK